MDNGRRDPFTTAYVTIRGWLADERWRAGDKLNLVAIADELRLSPTPVREAVSRLVGEELVEYRRAQGYFVPHLLVSEIEDLYSVIEALALQAVSRLSDDDFSATVRSSLPDLDEVADGLIYASANALALRIAGHARARLGPLERNAQFNAEEVTPVLSESKHRIRRAIQRHFAKRRAEAARTSAARERDDERLKQISRI